MPTIRNDSTINYQAFDLDGNPVNLAPGATLQTYDRRILAQTGIVETAATPYYNPLLQEDKPVSTGAGDDKTITLNAKAESVTIMNNSAVTLAVFRVATANTPGQTCPPFTALTLRDVRYKCNQLILQFSAAVSAGQVLVTQE